MIRKSDLVRCLYHWGYKRDNVIQLTLQATPGNSFYRRQFVAAMTQSILGLSGLIIKTILLSLTLVLAGCSSTYTSDDFIASGNDRNQPCGDRVYSYSAALYTGNVSKKQVSDETMAAALQGLRAVVPGCNNYEFGHAFHDVTYSLDNAISALSEVNAEFVGKNRISTVQALVDLLLAYANRRPLIPVFIRGSTVTHLAKIDPVLAKRLFQLGLERGFWSEHEFKYLSVFMSERVLSGMDDRFIEVRKITLQAYEKAGKAAGRGSCFAPQCTNVPAYRRALLNAFQELGFGNSTRVAVLQSMLKQDNTHNERQQRNAGLPASASPSGTAANTVSEPSADSKTAGRPVCNGNFAYLDPRLPKYRDPILANLRNQIVSNTMAKEAANTNVRQIIQLHEDTARQAAETANSTFGGPGQSTIQLADSETLSLDWRCQGIHGAAVCTYIANTWAAMMYRELAIMRSVCTAKGQGY